MLCQDLTVLLKRLLLLRPIQGAEAGVTMATPGENTQMCKFNIYITLTVYYIMIAHFMIAHFMISHFMIAYFVTRNAQKC